MTDGKKSPEAAVQWLGPEKVRARWEPEAARLALRIDGGEEIADARAALAFPVSAPGQFVDLCDAKKESVGMLRSLDGLDAGTRKAIEAALEVRYLIPRVERVLELSETAAFVLRWRMVTDRGERAFTTESPREAVKYQGPDRIRVTDMAGNHYDFPSISGLDPASRALLGTFL